ncbi:MAG: TauD/TfdA dioxygenase family protein [Burkholderiales bacterium]
MGATITTAAVQVRPLSPAVGAEITGIDLARLDDAAFAAVQAAWLAHSALLFRGQSLTHDDLLAFSRRLGALDEAPINENGKKFVDGYPEIYVVSNIKGADGAPIGSLGAGEAVWHTDMSYLPRPPDASMLYAVEVPPAGGNTWLCGLIAACAAMPEDLKRAVTGRSIKHDGTYNSGGYLRAGLADTSDPVTSSGTPHPIVCRHPQNGQQTLYLGRRRNAWVVGLPLAESEALLDRLWAHATQPQFAFSHAWRVGDVLLWDNRSTLHRRDPFDAEARRLMYRTQVRGSSIPQRAL